MTRQIKAVIFDWGDTIMRDFPEYKGAMAYWEKVEEITGMKEALEIISRNYICCVASNAGDSNAELMGVALNRVNIRKYFRHLFTSCELGVSKPNLNFFNKIVKKLSLRPEECIMVGNDYEKDIVPAKAVGIHTIFFTKESNNAIINDADYLINSMNKLDKVIMKFESIKETTLT
ncbi:HAD family hydrolase [Peribacillus glennii]|uniref:HAD family hydrolase n=1 Tax=Peribacillus glennii TaxID=2303991 RepID=A0A372LEF4_9BACI|nr:HAD family hydrolase [Peribacillus glennii]RFU64693.1 HAD family hydrolase [Peribacillus glennii]